MIETRGFRNRNPGNIRRSNIDWHGLAARQNDPEFATFVDDWAGIRAIARILLNYQRRHGLKTVREIINRWAPPTENNTMAYVDHVASVIGVSASAEIDLENNDTLTKLVTAIIRHENGAQPYTVALIREAVAAAQEKV